MLLRAQLERAKKSGRKTKSGAVALSGVKRGPMSRVRSMALNDGLSQKELSRALISGLLLEQFGEELVNTAQFQGLVDDILSQLVSDTDANKLLGAATVELVAQPGS